MGDFRQQFLAFALAHDVLRFGEFVTKAGRRSPYFFNAGLFSDGESLRQLGRFYAEALAASGIAYDQLFGPAYKGITLAAATAIALAEKGHNVPFCFNRKEAKDHGEGGTIVGTPLSGRVVIVDDVITDGAAKRESIEMIRAAGATPAAVLIALDRKERGRGAAVRGAGAHGAVRRSRGGHRHARRRDGLRGRPARARGVPAAGGGLSRAVRRLGQHRRSRGTSGAQSMRIRGPEAGPRTERPKR